ncbi:MAG: ATP-binding protein [Eubacteriales bacterium]|nr:ATP-binding protein [Eubacteriales bacterium]
MKRILFCCLLLTGICLSGCTGQINQPDTPPSTSEESDVLPGSESEESTEMPPKESTIPGEASKQALTLTIDGIAVDVRWEDNDAVSELLDYVKDAPIVVHTSAYQSNVDGTFVLHIVIHKTQKIIYASDGKAYIRHGVQNSPCDNDEKLIRLHLDKGLSSYEDEYTQSNLDDLKSSRVLCNFLTQVAPTTTPYDWLRRQKVMNSNAHISVAGVLLYDECPQATLPKQSAIKILRYHTEEANGTRETLDVGFPITIEGDIYSLIHEAVQKTKEIVETSGVVGESDTEIKEYPKITLHEIITNAVLHRDYSIKKDIQIRIFTNRIEIESPGKLPGHITLENILQEQCARNPKIVRLIAKFPSPPNKDVGEGLNSAFNAMKQMQLKEPKIEETESNVIVTIKHERLADAETIVWEYLQSHNTISNETARLLTGITDANKMKRVFYRLRDQGKIQIVEGTKSSATLWERAQSYVEDETAEQLSLF